MENSKKILIYISKILFHLSQLESHGVDLLQFLFDHVLTQTSFWFLSFHKLSAFPPIPTFPSGLLCLTQAVCLCLTAVLLPVGWDDHAKPGYPDTVMLAGREVCNNNTLRLPHIPDTPRNHVGPTYIKLALCFIHLAAKTHKLNLVSSNSSGNISIKISLLHSTNVKFCFLFALTSTPASSISGDHLQPCFVPRT